LLGDRGGARGGRATAGQERGPKRGAEVDAAVLVEKCVLRGQRGVDQILRDLIQWNDGPLTALRIVELPQQRAVAIEDLGRLEADVVADLTQRWQVAREHGVPGRRALQQDKDPQQAHAHERHQQTRADDQRL